jgi:hypothetical protein
VSRLWNRRAAGIITKASAVKGPRTIERPDLAPPRRVSVSIKKITGPGTRAVVIPRMKPIEMISSMGYFIPYPL